MLSSHVLLYPWAARNSTHKVTAQLYFVLKFGREIIKEMEVEGSEFPYVIL